MGNKSYINNIDDQRIEATEMARRLLGGDLAQAELDRVLTYFTSGEDAEMKQDALCEVFVDMLRAGRAETVARKHSARRWLVGIAATVIPVMVALAGLFTRDWFRTESEQQVVLATVTARATISAPEMIPDEFYGAHTRLITTPVDSINHICLTDGTQITLNGNSTLVYNNNRQVELSGDAYFKVAKNPEHPFTVYSDGLKVNVLGTEFYFNTHVENDSSLLSLYSGKVTLTHNDQTDTLDEAGYEVIFHRATGQIETREFDSAQRPHWMAGSVVVSDILSLGEILDVIENEYGVTVKGRGETDTDAKFKFYIDRASSLENIMVRLEYIDGEFAYNINGSTVTLSKKQQKL